MPTASITRRLWTGGLRRVSLVAPGGRTDDRFDPETRHARSRLHRRETNGHIRALARSFHDEREVGFFCECGCMGLVFATIAEYDEQGGVFIEGHETRLETTGGS
jgi:hypothetical protein